MKIATKKMKGGMTCKVLFVAMFVCANIQMFFVKLMIEMKISSILLQMGVTTSAGNLFKIIF